MDGEAENMQEVEGKEGKTAVPVHAVESNGTDIPKSPKKTLKDATSILKAEALRRYREKHRESLDRHEEALDEEFKKAPDLHKKSPSPGFNTPDIAEEVIDDVFYNPTESAFDKDLANNAENVDEFNGNKSMPGHDVSETTTSPHPVAEGQVPARALSSTSIVLQVAPDPSSQATATGPTSMIEPMDKDSSVNTEWTAKDPSSKAELTEKDPSSKAEPTEIDPSSKAEITEKDPSSKTEPTVPSSPDAYSKADLHVAHTVPQSLPLLETGAAGAPATENLTEASTPEDPTPQTEGAAEDQISKMASEDQTKKYDDPATPETNHDVTTEDQSEGDQQATEGQNQSEGDLQATEGQNQSEGDQQATEGQNQSEGDQQATEGQNQSEGDQQATEGQNQSEGDQQATEGQNQSEGDQQATEGQNQSEGDQQATEGQNLSEGDQQPTEDEFQGDQNQAIENEGQSEKIKATEDEIQNVKDQPTVGPNDDQQPFEGERDQSTGGQGQTNQTNESTNENAAVENQNGMDQTTADNVHEEKGPENMGKTQADINTDTADNTEKTDNTGGIVKQTDAENMSQTEGTGGSLQNVPAEGQDVDQKDTATEDGQQQKDTNKPISEAEKGDVRSLPADGEDPATRGDEDEIMSEASHVDDGAPKIPDDHYYVYDDHISKAVVTEDSGLPEDLLTLHHSFGYDCHKRANLHILSLDTAIFTAGNLVQLLNVKTKEQQYLRSTSGGGIGALTVHPSKNYFVVAEKGTAPNINIYEFPSLKLYRILRAGTEQSYAYVDFSPDGKLLASVGGDPDYMLTLWDWKQETIVLRSKAFSQDVFRVTFSAELEGQLTSSGTGHIRFWKKANTFTGLKLQGQLGKFGKKEISDIEGYVELPDGKVLSGSESGNLLLWDGGLIKVEICRKNKKPCHVGPISQVILDEGELMTVGLDGFIRVWDFETIDTADVTDEADMFEMEPMNELKVGTDVQLKSIVKSVDPEEPTMWYAQDANGGIWKLDLSFSFTSLAAENVMSYHAGPIVGCDTSPSSHLAVTVGVDGAVRVYDYLTKTTLCASKFTRAGSCVAWVPHAVDPKGASILAGFEDGVVRLLNFQKREEIPGRKHKEQTELLLKQAFKPHNGAVTAMAVDEKGQLLATGGADNTVFFLNIGENCEPLGFIQTPSEVTCLQWSPKGFDQSTLLVSCRNGEVLEVDRPVTGKFDTSHSFQISGLSVKSHKFKSVKSNLRHEEELAHLAKEQEEKKKKEEEERRIRIERGLETESDAGEEEDKKDQEEEEEWSPYIPADPSSVLCAFYGNTASKAWLSMGDFDAGYLYEVELLDDDSKERVPEDKLYEPLRTVSIHKSEDVPVRCIRQSASGKYLLMGLEDGSVRIQPLRNDDIGLIGPFWSLNIHDNHYGKITHLSTSHDDRYLFTVGEDGNFFVFEIMEEGKIEERVAAAKLRIPSARKELTEKKIDDIEDPSAYSIEDAKQKSEYDKMMKLAEEKKTGVRQTVSLLREQFRKLLDKNNQLPPHLQLNRKEFEMDPEIKRQLEQKTRDKVDLVHKQMAWEAEKHRVALEKLRFRFKDVVECERIVIKAFQTTHEVCSYRASKLSDDFYTAKAEMERRRTTMMSKDEASRQATQDLLAGQRQATDLQSQGEGQKEGTDTKIHTTLKGSMGERITKALAKVEDKKRKRALRRSQWEELYSTKPDDDYEDPADLTAIKDAKEHMGDYKLKSASDYVVPDHLRMNAEKARARLITLKEMIHKHKYNFNQKLLALRDKKIRIIEEIKEFVSQLEQVQWKLGQDRSKPLPKIPRLHPEEIPEKKYEYTREVLLQFKDDQSMKKEQAAKAVPSGGGFGGFGGSSVTPDARKHASPSPGHAGKQASLILSDQPNNLDWTNQDESKMSPLEKHLKQAEDIRLLYEQNHLLQHIEDLLMNFDAELRCLRHDKYKMDINLKNADLRHVTLFEELLLLKDFEKQENVLAEKVENKQQEKLDMQGKVIEVQQKLESKKKDIEKLQEKEKSLHATFVTSLGENNKFAEYLTKVFKKKIKRSKKKATDGAGSDEDSEDDSDDDSDWSESEEDSDSEAGGFDLDVCPPGCDQNLYDKTCAMREKRLDIEEDLVEEKKNRDALNKELETLQKRAKVIDSGLKYAEQELEAFQLEKQQKLNELDVVVTLKLQQIQHVVNGVLPQDLSQCLVFESTGVVQLQHRIKELEHEKSMQKRQQKDAKKKHIHLVKDRRVFEQRITDMEEQCNKMMLQKFGRVVDLEKLETVTVNRQLEELKEKLRLKEMECATEVSSWNDKIQGCKTNITDLIRQNTARLDQLNMLLGEKKQYEGELDSRQKNLGSEYSGARKSDVHERQRLIQLVHLQAQEIEALKEEIMLLSRKGGHILPPAQPPMPHDSQGMNTMSN